MDGGAQEVSDAEPWATVGRDAKLGKGESDGVDNDVTDTAGVDSDAGEREGVGARTEYPGVLSGVGV